MSWSLAYYARTAARAGVADGNALRYSVEYRDASVLEDSAIPELDIEALIAYAAERDDQEMVNYYSEVIQLAEEHRLLVNSHGPYRPTGLSRTWPNVISREGILGNKYNKWSRSVTPEHNVTIPFTRGALGEMDFTPGGFLQETAEDFRPQDTPPFVMRTRTHQLAMLVVCDSAIQTVADSPYN